MPFKYYGGVHPDYAKTASKTPVRTISPPPVVVLPMIQQIGAPNRPVVKVGDTVKLGQKIGDGEGVCSPVHASVSGTVAAVEQLPIPGGRKSVCVVIDSDGKDTPDPAIKPRATHKGMTPAELAAIVREAGICGMGADSSRDKGCGHMRHGRRGLPHELQDPLHCGQDRYDDNKRLRVRALHHLRRYGDVHLA